MKYWCKIGYNRLYPPDWHWEHDEDWEDVKGSGGGYISPNIMRGSDFPS